jgi:LPXTG-site transpeptidase (sortase) family protein
MKRRIVVLLGLSTPLVLAIVCGGAILLAAIAGWYFLGSDSEARILQIAPIAPLATFVADPTAEAAADTIAPEAGGSSSPASAGDIPSDPVVGGPPQTEIDAEEVLGFALPDGSVNSVTQAGAASRLVIPKLKVDAPVVISPIKDQSWQVDHLGQRVGHLEGTAPPGSNSNMVLAGHVTLAANVYGPFAGLAQLSQGDIMTVYQGNKSFNYEVDGYEIVERTAIEVTHPTNTGQLTLITCNNWNSEKGQYEQRLVVRSHLIDQ